MSLGLLLLVEVFQHIVLVDEGFLQSLLCEEFIYTAGVFFSFYLWNKQSLVGPVLYFLPVDPSEERMTTDIFSIINLITGLVESTKALLWVFG